MSVKILSVLTAFAILLALSACGKQPAPAEPATSAPPTSNPPATEPEAATAPPATEPIADVKFERVQDEYTLDSSGGSPLIRVSIAYPAIEALPGVNSFYSDWASDIEYTISFELEDAQRAFDDMKSIGREFYPYTYSADFEVMRNDGVLFSVMREVTSEMGGAHGGTVYLAENFIPQSGAMLTMDDLFTVPQTEYYARIKELVLEQIDERYGSTANNNLYQGFEQTMMDIYDPKHFCSTDTGVIFFWQEYALGPYTAGAQIFEIEYARISDILNAAWIK